MVLSTSIAGIRREDELLLCCATTRMDAERAKRIGMLLTCDTDWAYLLRTALRHGVMPLLYRNLNSTHPEAIPETFLGHLRDLFRENALRNLFLTAELYRIISLFEAHAIPAVPLRGPTLTAYLYGNLALRQFNDLDILVRSHDVTKARELLISHGYQPEFNLTGKQEKAFINCCVTRTFTGGNGRVFIELHWAVTPRYFSFTPDFEHIWRRIGHVSLSGNTIPATVSEDLLLLLCIHGASHAWERLTWICDLAELFRVHKAMDWRLVIEQAAKLGIRRMLFVGLYLANNLLGATLPNTVLRRIHTEPRVKSLATSAYKTLFREANDRTQRFERLLFYLRAMRRLSDRVRYCITPSSSDWVSTPLPCYFSYVLRPFRLLRKYVPVLARHLLRQ